MLCATRYRVVTFASRVACASRAAHPHPRWGAGGNARFNRPSCPSARQTQLFAAPGDVSIALNYETRQSAGFATLARCAACSCTVPTCAGLKAELPVAAYPRLRDGSATAVKSNADPTCGPGDQSRALLQVGRLRLTVFSIRREGNNFQRFCFCARLGQKCRKQILSTRSMRARFAHGAECRLHTRRHSNALRPCVTNWLWCRSRSSVSHGHAKLADPFRPPESCARMICRFRAFWRAERVQGIETITQPSVIRPAQPHAQR